MLRSRTLLVALGLALLPLAASATPITYNFVRGTTTIQVVQGTNTLVASDTATMTGTFVTFDDAVPQMVDFEFVIDDNSVNLGPLGFVDALLTASPGAGFTGAASLLSPNHFSWTAGAGAVDVVGSLSFTGGPLNGQTIPVNTPLSGVTGNFAHDIINGTDVSITGARDIYSFVLNGVPYKIQAIVQMNAQVPEPGTIALVAIGLAGLASRRRS